MKASPAQLVKPLCLLFSILWAGSVALPQMRDGAIAGHVQNADGTPAAGVYVSAIQSPEARNLSPIDPVVITTTDAEGRYRLSPVPPGRYTLAVHLDWNDFVSGRRVDATRTVVLQPGDPNTQDIVLSPTPRGVTVSGRVRQERLDRDARTISLSSGNRYHRAAVGADGAFSFRNVPSGDYTLSLPVPQFVWTSKNIHVEDRNVTGVEVIPDASIPVLGRIVTEDGSPVPSFSFALKGPKGVTTTSYVWVMDSVRSSPVVSVTGWADRPDDVLFHASLPIGEYRIALTRLPAGYRVKSFKYGTKDLGKEPLNLTGKIRQLTITVASPATRSVTVSGKVIRDVSLPRELSTNRISLGTSALLVPLEAPVHADGTFEISGVPPGTYWVGAPNVSSRLTVGNTDIRGLEFRTSRILALYEEAVRRASMPPPPSSTNSAEVTSEQTEPRERERRPDNQEAKIDGFEVPVDRPTKPVSVRVLVDQGYALPYLAFTVRPNVEAGPPYVEPYTLWSTQGKYEKGLIVRSDGEFSLGLPEGRHRIRVDAYPDSYRVKSVTYGSRDLTKELLTIDKTEPREIVITISALSDGSWGTVKGQIAGLTNIAEPIRIALASTRSKVPLFQAAPEPDGSFDFPKLPPDTYELLTEPRVAGVPPQSIVVKDGEVHSVSLAIPAQRTLNVRIRSEDGSLQTLLPLGLNLNLTRSKTEAYLLMVSVPFVLRNASEMICVTDVCGYPVTKMLGEPILKRESADGTTTLTLAEGDYSIVVSGVPTGRVLRSVTSGSVDLRDQSLRVGPTTTEITIVLSN